MAIPAQGKELKPVRNDVKLPHVRISNLVGGSVGWPVEWHLRAMGYFKEVKKHYVEKLMRKISTKCDVPQNERRFYTTQDGVIIDAGLHYFELRKKLKKSYPRDIKLHEDTAIAIFTNVEHDREYSYHATKAVEIATGKVILNENDTCRRMIVIAEEGNRKVVGLMQLGHLLRK